MAKKEKVVDLKSKAEKISKDQLSRVQSSINTINALTMDIGKLETQKHLLINRVTFTNDELMKLQKEFEKDYGTSDINIADGKINYPKDEQTN